MVISGAPPHFHGDAFNALAYGLKRWFLWPPEKSFYSSKSINDYRVKRGSKNHNRKNEFVWPKAHGRPLECMQEPGDVLFVPQMWGHATYNVKASVGVAIEFDSIFSRN